MSLSSSLQSSMREYRECSAENWLGHASADRIMHRFPPGHRSTQETLQKRGLNISSQGVKVKTDKVYNQEEYLDATQRCAISAETGSLSNTALIKSPSWFAHRKLLDAVKASSFGKENAKHSLADIDKHSHAAPGAGKKRVFGKK